MGNKNSRKKEIVKEILTEYELIIDSYEQGIEMAIKYEKKRILLRKEKKLYKKKLGNCLTVR